MENFFEELQSLDEHVKTRVLIITTIVIMAIVIYFWLGYFNSIVSNSAQPAVADANQPAVNGAQLTDTTAAGGAGAADNQPGLLERMGNGFAMMAGAFENFFKLPSKYIVKPN